MVEEWPFYPALWYWKLSGVMLEAGLLYPAADQRADMKGLLTYIETNTRDFNHSPLVLRLNDIKDSKPEGRRRC